MQRIILCIPVVKEGDRLKVYKGPGRRQLGLCCNRTGVTADSQSPGVCVCVSGVII